MEQPKDGSRRSSSLDLRDAQESAAGRMEQLADGGRSDPMASGLKDYATIRERADASVQCTGLGAACKSTRHGRARYLFDHYDFF